MRETQVWSPVDNKNRMNQQNNGGQGGAVVVN